MTTWAKLIDQCEAVLNDEDNSTFSVDLLIKWLNDAIRDYSQHFPRVLSDTISLTTGTSEYDLAADFLGVLSVEYPDGQDPREYLDRRPYTHPDFWSVDGYYDIITSDDDSNDSQIVFSDDVATGQDAIVQYTAYHDLLDDATEASDTITVPQQHQQLLVKYVTWQAALYLASAEQQSPTSNSSLLMAQLAQNARRLALDYSTALQQAIYAAEGKSQAVAWITTGHDLDRIY